LAPIGCAEKNGTDAECYTDAGAVQFAEGCAVVLADDCAEKLRQCKPEPDSEGVSVVDPLAFSLYPIN
jgi:hypothetical protein